MTENRLQAELEELRRRLEESEATLAAIRNGEVDAVVVAGNGSPRIYTLEGADHPYRVLVEAMQQGAVTLSPDGAIVYCNSSFASMAKRPYDKIIGSSIRGFFTAESDAALGRLLNEQHFQQLQKELILKADDGSELPVLVSFNLLPLDSTLAQCLVLTDLTEHHQNRDLKDTDRRKDEFLAMLAHELRNPLAPIANAAHMLCQWNAGGNADVSWACDVVERQVRQMTRIVDDLLDVSRITRGKINLQLAPADVSSIVTTAIETSRPLIEARKHKLQINLASEPLKVQADVTRLSQVLTNLLNNAAKYTEEGGHIWITVEREQGQVAIRVRDDGVGLSPEMLPKVFELFTQADRTIDRSLGGLGIGLTLVHRLVQLHGGSVEASSAGLGKGCEFVVRLPLLASKAEAEHPASAAHDFLGPLTRRCRILVVDDNQDSAATLARLLSQKGHDTQVAFDGPSAIQAAASFLPELVLLDIGLPGMNGYAVAEQMRFMPALKGTVIAALTGYGDEQDREKSRQAGFDYHFVKPLDFQRLRDVLASLCPN